MDIGEGMMISEPLVVEKGLRTIGQYINSFLSHKGILAIFSTNDRWV